jgi:hypothetical protein
MNDRPDRTSRETTTARAAEQTTPAEAFWISVNGRHLVRNVFIVCLLAELLFVLLDATVNFAGWTSFGMIRRMWNIAREDSLPSWFGTTQTCLVALTLWFIYIVARRDRRSRKATIGWLVLACFFTYMAADDGAQIHERVGSAFEKAHEADGAHNVAGGWGRTILETFPSYPWQFVFMPLFTAMGIFMLVFLWRELAVKKARILVLVALVLLSASVALDFVEGLEPEHPWNLYTRMSEGFGMNPERTLDAFGEMPYDTLRHFSKSIEEFLEMLAHTILWVVFLAHFMRTGGLFTIRFTEVPWSE